MREGEKGPLSFLLAVEFNQLSGLYSLSLLRGKKYHSVHLEELPAVESPLGKRIKVQYLIRTPIPLSKKTHPASSQTSSKHP